MDLARRARSRTEIPKDGASGRKIRGRERVMIEKFHALAVAGGVLMAMSSAAPVLAQKQGGILRQYMISPARMSIHEEATPVATRPVMAVFNNLVLFDEHVPQNSLSSIVPDLATD